MRRKRWCPSFWVIFIMDVLMSLMIIVIVIGVLVSTIEDTRKVAYGTTAVSEGVGLWRNNIMVYHAIYGEWPQSEEDMKQFMPEPEPEWEKLYEDSGATEEIIIIGGALDLKTNGPLDGGIITVHPAVPSGDPLGPVRWVAGSATPEGWTVIGEDHTTVNERYIPRALKQ